MVSRSSAINGADIWHPRDRLEIPASETSFLWYLPAPSFTSKPYQFIYSESISVGTNLDSISLMLPPLTVEGIDLTTNLESLEYKQVLKSYTDGIPEELDLAVDLDAITFKVALLDYEMQEEFLQLDEDLDAITFKVALLTYVDWIPEELALTVDLEGVILT